MGLRGYLIKRSIYSIILLLFVLSLNFIIFELMPGNPIETLASSGRLMAGQPEQVMELWGLTRPLHERYGKYIYNMLIGEFGISYYTFGPVSQEIGGRLVKTLLLVGSSTVLSIIIGVFLGVFAAYKRGGIFDSVSIITSLTTYSLPSFWMGMIFLMVFAYRLRWFPSSGSVPPQWGLPGNWPEPFWVGSIFGMEIAIPSLVQLTGTIRHLVLPVTVLTLFSYGGYLLLTRATMLETLTEDYVLTARAKGLRERTILFKHALKNASLPLITSAAMSVGFLLTGAIITEQVFSYPGLGKWIWDSITFADYPAIQAIFYVIALCVIVANFIADILYGIVDPRVRYG